MGSEMCIRDRSYSVLSPKGKYFALCSSSSKSVIVCILSEGGVTSTLSLTFRTISCSCSIFSSELMGVR